MDNSTVIPAGFHGAAALLNQADIDRSAAALGISDRLVESVAYVEGSNHGFIVDDGRPQLLFEAHQFHNLTGGSYDSSHPNISSATWDASLYGAAGAHQYDRLTEAMALNRDAALQAATWGMFQELGSNYASVGYATIDAFVSAMCASEGNHIDVFVAHCTVNHLQGYLQSQDWLGFAEKYNGPGAPNLYAAKLMMAYQAGKFPTVLPAPTTPPVPPVTTPPGPPAPPSTLLSLSLRPGWEASFPVEGVDQDGSPIALAADALSSSDASVATVEIAAQPDGSYLATAVAGGVGRAALTGAGLTIGVAVEAATLAKILADLSKMVKRKVPMMAAAMALLMMAPAGLHEMVPQHEAIMASAPLPPALPDAARDQPKIWEPGFCVSDPSQPARAINRCLAWTSALRSHR